MVPPLLPKNLARRPWARQGCSRTACTQAPLHRTPIGPVLLALLFTLALAACNGGGAQTPGDDGRVDPLPPDVPVGTDPGDGTTTCVVSDRTFDDDVTVPADLHCVFYNVIIEGNLVLLLTRTWSTGAATWTAT